MTYVLPGNRRNGISKWWESYYRRMARNPIMPVPSKRKVLKMTEKAVLKPKKPIHKTMRDETFVIGNRIAILPQTLYEEERFGTVIAARKCGLIQKIKVRLDGSKLELVYYSVHLRKLEHGLAIVEPQCTAIVIWKPPAKIIEFPQLLAAA